MKTTKIYLILIMILLMSSCVLATTTITDIKIEGLQYINATDNICVSNPNLCLINAIMSSWINITYDYELDNGTIIRSWNTTFVTDNAYNTEGELTALLDDNYIAIGTKLGNTSTEVADMLSNTTIVRASNTSWVTDLVTGADNESFNQSHTDTLYQASGSYYNQSQIDNTTIVRSYNTSWITDNQLTYTSDNTTWTQLVADGLYAVLGSGSDNETFNQTLTDTLYVAEGTKLGNTSTEVAEMIANDSIVRSTNTSWITDNQLTYTSDNTTWNQIVANGLYADISVTGDNISWSQLIANGLYADISVVDTTIGNCSDTDSCSNIVYSDNTSWITDNQNNLYNTSSEIFDAVNNESFASFGYGDDWNETYADTLYADISVSGDNESFNQSHTDDLYIWTVGDDWNSYSGNVLTFNESKLVTIYYNATSATAITGTIEGTLVLVSHPDGNYDGQTLNITEASGSPGLDVRINFTDITELNGGVIRYYTSNLAGDFPLIQLWSYTESEWEDYPSVPESESFATIQQPVYDDTEHVQDGVVQMRLYKAGNGKTNNHYYVDWIAIIKGYGTPAGEEVDPFWMADKSDYYNTTQINITTIIRSNNETWVTGLVTQDNVTWNQLVANGLYADISVTGDNTTWNQNIANDLYINPGNTSWITDNQLTYTSDNATWNQLVANGLYADISVTGDNITWNQLVANGLYADIGIIPDNVTWNQLVANGLYADIGIIADNTTWNQLVADGLYADISVVDTTISNCSTAYSCDVVVYSGNTSWITDNQITYTSDNTTWNQIIANGLYADISVTGDNITWNQLVANGLYVAEGTKLGNTTAEINTAEIDADHDECSEITGCRENALTNATTIQPTILNATENIYSQGNITINSGNVFCLNIGCTRYIWDNGTDTVIQG